LWIYKKLLNRYAHQRYLERTESVDNHWQESWVWWKEDLKNVQAADFGVWWGLSNFIAEQLWNCRTVVATEWNDQSRSICHKILPNCTVYPCVEEIDRTWSVDVILMHGYICLLGADWQQHLTLCFSQVRAPKMICRHRSWHQSTALSSSDRESNPLDLKTYDHVPSHNELCNWMSTQGWVLREQKGDTFKFELD